MREAWFGELRSHVGFGMEGIAHPPPRPAAFCRRISFNATALSLHFTELDADSGGQLTVCLAWSEDMRPSPTRSHRGGCLSSRVRRGRAWIREKPLKPVGLVPANIRDSRAPEMPSSPAHLSHPPLLEALLVQAQQLVACGQVQLRPHAHHSAGINRARPNSLLPTWRTWLPLHGALPACPRACSSPRL